MNSTESVLRLSAGTRVRRGAARAGALVLLMGLAWPVLAENAPAESALRLVENPAGGVEVEWTVPPGPFNAVGWHVERQLSDGQALRVTEERVEAGLFDPPGMVYRFQDVSAPGRPGETVAYRLVTVDPELHEQPGAFTGQTIAAAPPAERTERKARLVAPKTAKAVLPVTTGQWVRIVVTNDGLYRLTAAQLAGVLTGTNASQVAQSIAKTNFSLTCGGTAVAWRAESGGAALLFFGQAYRDTYDDQNVYWLKPGPGLAMGTTNRTTSRVAANPWFWETVRAEENAGFRSYLPGDEADDYFMWTGWRVVSPSASQQWTTSVPLVDRHSDISSGTVTAYLASEYNGTPELDNRTVLSANGEAISDESWAGDIRLVQSGTATGLNSDTVAVKVEVRRKPDVTTTFVFLDALEVRYARQMRARNNQLLFRPRSGTNTVTVRGYTSASIQVYDVSNPLRPVAVTPTIAQEGAEWRASWTADPATSRRYLAVSGTASPERIDGVNDRGWTRARTGAPHLVIAPRALRSAANALVVHRRDQGLDSMLVPLEELYDAFSFGRRDPHAIPRFLALANAQWTVKPLYVCLAGHGHLDYHDYFKQAETRPNHIPPILDRVPYNAQANGVLVTLGLDNPLGDMNGDGNPEVVIGRLPAQTPAALTAMINRIKTHEAAQSWKNKVLLVADRDGADTFVETSRRLARRVPPGMDVQQLNHAADKPVETMRADFAQAMNAGPVLAFYFGHGNNIGLSSPYFFTHNFTTSNMPLLTNAARGPVVIAGTCLMNDHAGPYTNNYCLGKGFLDTAPGGAVAVWASAAEATLGLAESMSGAILDKVFSAKTHRLGDLLRPALDIQAGSISPWTVRTGILLGDPGLRIRTHLYSDNTRPAIWITQPLPAASFKTTTNRLDLAGTASDLNGIVRVVIRNDRSASEYTAVGSTNWRRDRLLLQEGSNRISAIAYDSAGNTATASLSIVYWVHHKINCGGGEAAGGWRADRGGWTTADGGSRTARTAVANADQIPQAVYQTGREGTRVSYAVNVPDGYYNVRLHFAEPRHAAAGQRIFTVSMEGLDVLTNFDIFRAAGGRNRAVQRGFAKVRVQGGLLIRAVASQGQALINGIEVWPANGPAVLPVPFKLNSGRRAAVAGWRADEGWRMSADGRARSSRARIANTAGRPQAMYRTWREARRITYNLNIPDGTYKVRLHFAEPTQTAAGSRVFNVAVEGRTVLRNLDVFRSAPGKNRALRKTITRVTVRDGLNIRLKAVRGQALIAGIEVWALATAKSAVTGAGAAPVQEPAADAAAPRTDPPAVLAATTAGPRAEARSDQSDWAPAPELVDGDTNTVWIGDAGAATWSIAVDLREVMPLQRLDLLFDGGPWSDFSVLGTADQVEWVDLDQAAEFPVPCRALFIQLRGDGSGTSPAIRDIQWNQTAPD